MKNCLYVLLISILSCSTSPKHSIDQKQKTIAELEQHTREIQPPKFLDEKLIRRDLEQFKKIVNSKKVLGQADWHLHDTLLDNYIKIKRGLNKPNTIFVPAHTRWTKNFESYCLEAKKASPDVNEQFEWIKSVSKTPYVKELLQLTSKGKHPQQGDVQAIIWNLNNKTNWEEYPEEYQHILLSIDSKAKDKLPNELQGAVKTEAIDLVKEYLPESIDHTTFFIEGKFYDYQQIKASIESLKSKQNLKSVDKVIAIEGTVVYAKMKSDGFQTQEVTFYNPTDKDVIVDLSDYQLKPQRSDVQLIALLQRALFIDPNLLNELEKTLYDNMFRLGLGHAPILGDLIDLFEASTGKDFFNNDLLTNQERFMSAMAILAGSGLDYRYAKKIVEGPEWYVRDSQNKYRLIKNEKGYGKLKDLADEAYKKGVPDGWGVKVSKIKKGEEKFQGLVIAHPEDRNIKLRIMPGNPNSKYPNSKGPYVKQEVNNVFHDKNGKIVDNKSDDAHIPLSEWKFIKFWEKNGKK